MYLLIALMHGVPVFIVSAIYETKAAVFGTAALMIAIGVLTGDPAYAVLDVVSVAVTMWICLRVMDPQAKSPSQTPSKASQFFGGMLKDLFQSVFGLAVAFAVLIAVIIFYNKTYGDCADSKLQQASMTFEQCRALQKKPKK